jgi:hypothetical protein
MNKNGFCGINTFEAIVSPYAFVDTDSKLTINLEFSNPLSDSVTLETIKENLQI